MDIAVREFLRGVRGARSQVAFARKLGYLGNPIADWEAGRRSPTVREALRACELSNIDVCAAFAGFHAVPLRRDGDDLLVAEWLNGVRGLTSARELARRSGHSPQRVARWLRGTTEPRLPDFFRLVQAITGRLCDLVAQLVPIESVASLRAEYEQRAAARRLAHEEPWTEAILRVLETEGYRSVRRHAPGDIAAALGLDPEVERRALDQLERAGIVRRRGRGHCYEPARSLTVDTRAIPKLKSHWCGVAQARLEQPRADDVFTYNVLSASRSDLRRIRQLILATFREIRGIVEHTPRDEAVALVNLQMVTWCDEPDA